MLLASSLVFGCQWPLAVASSTWSMATSSSRSMIDSSETFVYMRVSSVKVRLELSSPSKSLAMHSLFQGSGYHRIMSAQFSYIYDFIPLRSSSRASPVSVTIRSRCSKGCPLLRCDLQVAQAFLEWFTGNSHGFLEGQSRWYQKHISIQYCKKGMQECSTRTKLDISPSCQFTFKLSGNQGTLTTYL